MFDSRVPTQDVRVGIDATSLGELSGGSAGGLLTYTRHILKSIIKYADGIRCYVYCLNEIPPDLPLNNPAVVPRLVHFRNRKIWQQLFLPFAALRDRIDLLFFPANSVSLVVPCKSVTTIHDLTPYIMPRQYRRIHTARLHGNHVSAVVNHVYWKWMLRLQARQDRVIADSKATRQDLIEVFGTPADKIEVIYLGVDTEMFTAQESLSAKPPLRMLPASYILCIGTQAHKNLDGSIRAFDIVRASHPHDIKLVVVGSERGLTRSIERLVGDLGLSDDIVFTGFVSTETLKYLYRRAQVLLFPSLYEGFGLPVLEAFACGTPVVTSNRGSLPEVAGDAALLVNPDDPDDIASAVLRLLQDSELRQQKRQQALRRVERFSWERAGQETLCVFREMLGVASPRARAPAVAPTTSGEGSPSPWTTGAP